MKQAILLALCLVVFVACGGGAAPTAPAATTIASPTNTAPTADNSVASEALAILQTYDFALNGHDVEATLLLFADDAVVDIQTKKFEGKDQIRGWLAQIIQQNIHTEVKGSRSAQGDTVTWTETITRDDYKKLGVDPAVADVQAVVRNSKIESFNVKLTPDTQAKLDAAQQAAQPTTGPQPTAAAAQATALPNGAVVITASGAISLDIQAQVEAYKQLLGGADNGGTPGSQSSGFRTITWDGVPDNLAAPNDYPPDFFNAATEPRARGAVLSTPGTALRVSAKAGNPTNTPPRFGDINPSYANIFKTYSGERLFSPIGSNKVTLEFFVPGTKTPAVVRGYGAVYTDVDTDHTAFEYFDAQGNSLGKYGTPISDNGLSFLGVAFPDPIIHRVEIEYGTVALGPDDSATNDVAVMDDFIYGEPQPIQQVVAQATTQATAAPAPSATQEISPTGTTTITVAAGTFVQLGTSLNHDKKAAATDQALTLGSLFAGAEYIPWATWAEKQGSTQQIFVSRLNGDNFEPVGASLNIHQNVVAEHPSIDFAGQDRTVPWAAWYEPSPGFSNKKQVFASRFNKDTLLWTPAGQDRGSNEPSLNIHTNEDAEDPVVVGGTANPANPPTPWVCWQEDSAHSNSVQIFVSRGVKDDTALGGFKWQPVGVNRGGTTADPEPSLNVDFAHSDGQHCWITFAETNNAVPWVVWDEISGGKSGKIFVARAIQDDKATGGFHWQFVPNCTGAADEDKCALNVNPTQDANDPFMTAGSVSGGATVPWLTWTEVGPTGKKQVFVDRLDQVSRDKFLNVGGSLNVDQNRDAEGPSITFLGNVPYVAWSEQVGSGARVFVRHLASDPQTGTWVLDTPQDGLAVDKTKATNYPIIRAAPGSVLDIIWREGDPDTEASQIVVCQSGKLSAFNGGVAKRLLITPPLPSRVAGFALPLLQNKPC